MRKGFVMWLTGLPCSGKTTLAQTIQKEFSYLRYPAEILDGDVTRKSISPDLGYSKEDRDIHARRVTRVAQSLAWTGVPVIVALISPYRAMRERARACVHPFVEIYVRCPLKECEKRDVKGLYRLARNNKIINFTGVSDPYEEPLNPEITVDTDTADVTACVEQIMGYLEKNKLLQRSSSVMVA